MQAGCAEQMSTLSILPNKTLTDEQRQYNWERGQIDYLGADSFDSILSRLDAKLASPSTDKKPATTKKHDTSADK